MHVLLGAPRCRRARPPRAAAHTYLSRSGLTTAVLLWCASGATGQAQEVAPSGGPADPAAAATCNARRYIVLGDGPEPLGAALTSGVMAELGTELQERGLGVCLVENPERPPSAVVQLSRPEAKRVLVDIDDRATDKRISRSVSLVSLPPDGHALAIAVAIDELLRASWAELLLQRDEAPDPAARSTSLSAPPRGTRREARAAPPPTNHDQEPARGPDTAEGDAPPANAAPPRSGRAARRSRAGAPWWLVGGPQYWHAQPSFDAVGGYVRGHLALPASLRAGLGLRAYHALRVEDARGSSAATALGAELSVGACLALPVRLCADALFNLDGLRFSPRAGRDTGAAARSRIAFPATLTTSFGAEWPSDTALFGRLSLDLGVALHGVEARSEDGALLGLRGFVLGAGLGLGVRP